MPATYYIHRRPYYFTDTKRYGKFLAGNPLTGVSNAALRYEKVRFSTNISVSLENDTRYSHSYNEILIGTYALLKDVISSDLE